MIRIEKLRKQYDPKTVALDDMDLVFEDSMSSARHIKGSSTQKLVDPLPE